MVRLTHLNGKEFYLNSDLLLCLESTPDTLLVMTSGEKILVKESPEEVVDRIVGFRRRIGSDEVRMHVFHSERGEPEREES